MVGRLLIGCLLAVLSPVAFAPTPALADPVRDRQWHLETLQVREAWQYATGKNVVIAVLDSGVDADHPDLAGKVLPGADFVDGKGDARTDSVGHGTTVAALIAGRNDPAGVVGIAYSAKILPVRVLDRKNRYDDARTVAKGLRWAVDHGADIVNMSLGGSLESTELAEAIQYAFDRDVVVVACGGNGDGKRLWYPAREPGVVAVTGLNRAGRFWSGSLSGSGSALSAPATRILGARPGGYWTVQGTSFAAPMVSATAALIRSHWPDMDAANVVNQLIRTAQDRGPVGRDKKYGYGVVDPVAALSNPVISVRDNPLDTTPRVPAPSGSWSVQPAAQAAPPPDEAASLWWWLAFGVVGAVGFSAGIGLVAVRRRRATRLPDISPLLWHSDH